MPTNSLLHHTTSPLTERDLDNACFLDWLAAQSGYFEFPGWRGIFRIELDRDAVLRVTEAVTDTVVPITVIELRKHGRRCGELTAARRRPALPLAELREQPDSRRLVLEATLQRRRLYPHWIRWIEAMVSDEYDAVACDHYILRFHPKPRFDDLIVIARITPWIGIGMMWSLFCASPLDTAELFEEWIAAGQPERFRDLGSAIPELVTRCADSPFGETMIRVGSVMAHYGYVGVEG